MIAVLQRVSEASVEVENRIVAAIEYGVLVFVAVMAADGAQQAVRLADRVADFRILPGPDGRPAYSTAETPGAALLVVSQFTLGANTRKGRRADYGPVAKPEPARRLVDSFVHRLRERELPVQTGVFGADMRVRLCNEGPVTFRLEVE